MFDKTRLPYVVLDVVCVVLGMPRVPQRGGSGEEGEAPGHLRVRRCATAAHLSVYPPDAPLLWLLPWPAFEAIPPLLFLRLPPGIHEAYIYMYVFG